MYLDGISPSQSLSNQSGNIDFDYSDSSISIEKNSLTESRQANQSEDNKKTENKQNELKNIIESANDGIQVFNKSIEFTIHEETNKIMVKIVDNVTDEVLKEIPPENILDMVAKFCKMAGIIVDEKV